jgi:SAM-dependent methyltransferase
VTAVRRTWRERAGIRFARLTTRAVVARPGLWRLLRAPLRAQFDALAPRWEGLRGPDALAPLEAALDRVVAARRVLDLGTGTGRAARVAARRFPEATVVGVDLSERMIEEARRLLPAELAGRVRLEVADASALPFPDASFDLVVLLNMIPFFAELGRVTAPGGTLVLAFYSGPATPIYVPSDTLRAHLAPLGFERFEELAAGEGTAFLARRAEGG